MIDRLMRWLGADEAQDSDSLDPKRAAAALMVEVLAADHNWQASERDKLKQILASPSFGISAEDVDGYFEMAREDHAQSADMYRYTKVINAQFSAEQKQSLILALWQVALADGHLDRYEEAMIRKLADLLYLPHQGFIEAKLQAQAER